MIIGGIQKTSLIDFPAKISCVVFTGGCNFACPYCHNAELVNPPFKTISQDEVFAFLNTRLSLLDGVVITGGEPTLQSDLLQFCEKIKTLGFPIKLDTNGSHPQVIRSLIERGCLDYIAMDIKTLPEKYGDHIAPKLDAGTILESIHLILNANISHEFRTTCLKPFVDADIILQVARIISGADLFVLQKAHIDNSVLHPDFFQNRDWKFAISELSSFQKIAQPFVKKTIVR